MPATARKLNVVTPNRKVDVNQPQTLAPGYSVNPYIKKTRALIIKTALCLAFLAIVVVTFNARLATAQLQLQEITQNISQINNSNESKKQEISELSSRSRLNKIAKEAGLTMDEQKIRNVTK